MTSAARSPETVFNEAIEIRSPAGRRSYLDRACEGDMGLRQAVEKLITLHSQAGDFLESPAVNLDVTAIAPPLAERPGTVIGPYKLLQQIGEGGMGVVFMAEQTEPIQRTVALKIIKPGMDSRQVIARFEAERQALAVMDHPNIAKVLDTGTTDAGRPYFVMELVKGVPITKYCDDRKLSLRERLELFTPVCQAVQHAHQKGIIHRDIKPTNVLVAEYDGKPVPKIIDFGVAKATAQRLTERTMFTEFGQVIGTVEYMSPEQACFNQLDIDTRSDIYSLGVLLYELLTGSTPFERNRLREAAFDEVLRIIREEEPPKPSTRLSTSETLPSIAANRHTEPVRLSKDVSGELDWIVMKCLEKDRNRRYETAIGLVRDIERYLSNEPVQACPPSAIYRFRKFVQRNKIAITTACIVVVALVAGTVISTWQAIRATRAEAVANARRIEAEAKSRSIDGTVRGYLERGQYSDAFRLARVASPQQLESMIETSSTVPTESSNNSLDALVLGELRLLAGDLDGALKAIQLADTMRRDEEVNRPRIGYATHRSLYKTLGWAQLSRGQEQEARKAFQAALQSIKRGAGDFDLDRANPDELTAAYFLDLLTEKDYVARLKRDEQTTNFPWFYIGQRREIEGNRAAAIEAYKRCVEVVNIESPQRSLARWRLKKLGKSAE